MTASAADDSEDWPWDPAWDQGWGDAGWGDPSTWYAHTWDPSWNADWSADKAATTQRSPSPDRK